MSVMLLKNFCRKNIQQKKYKYDENIKEGYIISYTPQKGVELPPGTEVQMVVSKGPEEKPFPMPDLVGKDQSMATSIITTSNLTLGQVRPEFDDTVEEGKVVSQYPLKDTPVTEGTTVNLVVSKGPDPATLPPDPPPVDPGTVTDPTPVTKYINVKLDGYEGTVMVRVLMDSVEVGSGSADASMDASVDIAVHGTTGMGVKELAIYINGVASGTDRVNFDE